MPSVRLICSAYKQSAGGDVEGGEASVSKGAIKGTKVNVETTSTGSSSSLIGGRVSSGQQGREKEKEEQEERRGRENRGKERFDGKERVYSEEEKSIPTRSKDRGVVVLCREEVKNRSRCGVLNEMENQDGEDLKKPVSLRSTPSCGVHTPREDDENSKTIIIPRRTNQPVPSSSSSSHSSLEEGRRRSNHFSHLFRRQPHSLHDNFSSTSAGEKNREDGKEKCFLSEDYLGDKSRRHSHSGEEEEEARIRTGVEGEEGDNEKRKQRSSLSTSSGTTHKIQRGSSSSSSSSSSRKHQPKAGTGEAAEHRGLSFFRPG